MVVANITHAMPYGLTSNMAWHERYSPATGKPAASDDDGEQFLWWGISSSVVLQWDIVVQLTCEVYTALNILRNQLFYAFINTGCIWSVEVEASSDYNQTLQDYLEYDVIVKSCLPTIAISIMPNVGLSLEVFKAFLGTYYRLNTNNIQKYDVGNLTIIVKSCLPTEAISIIPNVGLSLEVLKAYLCIY